MKSIMVVDGAINCKYETYAISDELYSKIFFGSDNKFAFIEEVVERVGEHRFNELAKDMFKYPIRHVDIVGLDGILFYELIERMPYYL